LVKINNHSFNVCPPGQELVNNKCADAYGPCEVGTDNDIYLYVFVEHIGEEWQRSANVLTMSHLVRMGNFCSTTNAFDGVVPALSFTQTTVEEYFVSTHAQGK
jgi:hypothetical protein